MNGCSTPEGESTGAECTLEEESVIDTGGTQLTKALLHYPNKH